MFNRFNKKNFSPVPPSPLTYSRRIWFLFCKTWHTLSKTFFWSSFARSFAINQSEHQSYQNLSDLSSRHQDYRIVIQFIVIEFVSAVFRSFSRFLINSALKSWLYFFEPFVIFHRFYQRCWILKGIHKSHMYFSFHSNLSTI